MRKGFLAVVAVAVAVVVGAVVATTTMAVDRATLRARVTFLERVLQQRAVIPEGELAELEARLTALESAQVPRSDRVVALIGRLERLEAGLPYPVVSASMAREHMGQLVAVYGTVARVTRKQHLWIDMEGLGLVWFGGEKELPEVQAGTALVVVGVVSEYQGSPQIRLDKGTLVVAER